jgi:hypothetical protein
MQKTLEFLVDDLDGSQEDVSTVMFSVNDKPYIIDLSKKNAEQFRAVLEPYVAAARKSFSPVRSTRSSSNKPSNLADVRQWASTNGHKVSSRGRIPAAVLSAYEAAH